MEVKIEGLSELLAKLENARVQMDGPEMKKALLAGGKVIQKAMIERAPMLDGKTPGSDALEPGALKSHIKVRIGEDDNGDVAAIIGPTDKVAYVARFVEYGHRQVHGGYLKLLGNGKTRGTGEASLVDVPAHPFLRPAFEESVADAGEAIKASLTESFKELMS